MADEPIERCVEWSYPRRSDILASMRDAIVEFLSPYAFSDKFVYKVKLCADEAAANVIEHGGAIEQNPEFKVKINVFEDKIEIILCDQCGEFNPVDDAPEVDIKEHVAAGKKGGLGVMFLKTLLDEFEHSFENDQNHLRMVLKKPQ